MQYKEVIWLLFKSEKKKNVWVGFQYFYLENLLFWSWRREGKKKRKENEKKRKYDIVFCYDKLETKHRYTSTTK